MNISMIAERAGVSKSSVSNYLNNKNGKLSAETADRIAKVIQESNYIPSFGARRLKSLKPSKTIGIVIKDTLLQSMFSIPFYGLMMKGIGSILDKAGYNAIIIPANNNDSSKYINYLKDLSRGLVDGYLLFNIHVEDKYVKEFSQLGMPFICMGNMFNENLQNYVGTDYQTGAKYATRYLLTQGSKNIAISIGIPESIVSKQLFDGFTEEMKNAGVPIDENLVIKGKSDMDESIFDELLTLFQQPTRPDGVLLPERHFYDLVEVSKVLGFDLFKDLNIVLYSYYFRMVDMAFSYLDIPYEEVGVAAATNLLNLLNGKTIQPILFKPRLVMR